MTIKKTPKHHYLACDIEAKRIEYARLALHEMAAGTLIERLEEQLDDGTHIEGGRCYFVIVSPISGALV